MSDTSDPLKVYRETFMADLRRTPGAVRSSEHEFRAGGVGSLFVDIDMLSVDPGHCRRILTHFQKLVGEIAATKQIDYVAFIDKRREGTLGAIQYAAALSIALDAVHYVVRLEKRVHSERIKIPGIKQPPREAPLKGEVGILVTDHSTTGTEIEETIETLEEYGASLKGVAILTTWLDDFSTVRSQLEKKGITVQCLAELKEEDFDRTEVLVSQI